MSIPLIKHRILRFLASEKPEVICISGRWGVGKTYAWNKWLEEASNAGNIGLKGYSYISLFGIDSLEEFRYTIFQNSVSSAKVGIEPSFETMRSNTGAVAKRLGKGSLWFLQQIPWLRNHIGNLGPVWFLSVKKQIICVDDIERRGRNLSVRDVLGLVSSLKEQRQCKVALILNDEALEDDERDFGKYLEKVIDVTLRFAPNPVECVEIALDGESKQSKLVAEFCVRLGVSNIRVIKKIEYALGDVEAMLNGLDEQVCRQAAQSLTLLGWSVFEPALAPPLDYLKRRGEYFSPKNKRDAVSETEAAWNALLDAYRFWNLDDFDLALLKGLLDGYFDAAQIRQHAAALDERIKASKADDSLENGWRLYHDSFKDNEKEAIGAILHSARKNIQRLGPVNLSGAVGLLKELGRHDEATDLIQSYIDSMPRDRKFFDLANHPFAASVKDEEVIAALNQQFASLPRVSQDPASILLLIARTKGWNDEQLEAISALTVDELYEIFKTNEGQALRDIISACFLFNRVGTDGQPTAIKELPSRAKEALTRIGQESGLNAARVKKYGINVQPKKGDDVAG